jgi:hypothetical protein
MIVKVVRDYLSHDKCNKLNDWVKSSIAESKIGKGITIDGSGHYSNTPRTEASLRYTSRMYGDKYEYPQLVRDIHAQIEQDFNLSKWHLPVHTHGRDATVVSATMPGGDVYLHKDPVDGQEPKHVLRCNILTSETEGGLIWVGGESYSLKKGDMMQYLVSKHEHRVEPVAGNPGDLRIMWMFGWYVDADEWETLINASSS